LENALPGSSLRAFSPWFVNSDFGDALRCAYARSAGREVATFDKGILKMFSKINAFTPTDWLAGTIKRPLNRNNIS
jgi:hypothetical protein